MPLMVPNSGEIEFLARALNKNVSDDCVLKLYTNDKTPVEGDVVGDYNESTAPGYSDITLIGSNWTIASSGGTTSGQYPQQIFNYSGAESNIYGYYVVNAVKNILLWAERFSDGPYHIPGGGGSIKLTPKIELE